MKKTLGIIIISVLLCIRFFIETGANVDSDIQFWSNLTTFVLICGTILLLAINYRINIPKELQLILNFRTNPETSQESLKKLLGGSLIPTFAGIFVVAPLISFSLIQINTSDFSESKIIKNEVLQTYRGGKNKYYVDIIYDGEPVTLRVSRSMKKKIDKNSQLPNLNRGRLGFYFIQE